MYLYLRVIDGLLGQAQDSNARLVEVDRDAILTVLENSFYEKTTLYDLPLRGTFTYEGLHLEANLSEALTE